jgi:hypothetical protein
MSVESILLNLALAGDTRADYESQRRDLGAAGCASTCGLQKGALSWLELVRFPNPMKVEFFSGLVYREENGKGRDRGHILPVKGHLP